MEPSTPPSGGDGWAERKRRVEETAASVEHLERKIANTSLAIDGYNNVNNIGKSMGAPIDKIEERATAFEKAQEALARAGGILHQQKELSQSALTLADKTNTKWEEITAARRAFVGLGGGSKLAQLRPVEADLLKLAFASNSNAADLYQLAFSYMRTGLTAEKAVAAIRINYGQGKKGSYELKDLAPGMMELSSQGKEIGLSAEQVAIDLPALLQLMRSASGSTGAANTRLRNVMKQFTDPKVQEKIESELGIDVPKEMEAAKAAGENPLFRVLNQIADKMQAVPKAQLGTLGKGQDEGNIIGGSGELGAVFRNYYVRAGVEAFAQLRGELKQLTPTADEASKTAISDFASRAETLAASNDRLAIALDAAAVKAGNTQIDDKKKMNERKAGAVNWMMGVAEKYPGLTSGAIDAWDSAGKAVQVFGASMATIGTGYMGWLGLKQLGTKFPMLSMFGQGANAAAVNAVAKAGGIEAAKAAAEARGFVAGSAIRAAGGAVAPLSIMSAVDATDDASASYRRMKADYAKNQGHEVESWEGAKHFFGSLFNGLKSVFGEKPGSNAGAQAGAVMAAAPATTTVDQAAIDSAKQRILDAGTDMKAALEISGSVLMDTVNLDSALNKAKELATVLRSIGGLAAQANLGLGGRGLKPSSGALHDGPETK